jgi:hypothetical protein
LLLPAAPWLAQALSSVNVRNESDEKTISNHTQRSGPSLTLPSSQSNDLITVNT